MSEHRRPQRCHLFHHMLRYHIQMQVFMLFSVEPDLRRPLMQQVSLQGPQGPAVIDSIPDPEALQQVAAAADDDGELEDLAPLPLGPVVEVQDPAALPQDPELLWSHVLRQRRCHLFQCILRILSILLCLVLHHLVLLLCLEQQLLRRYHHRLCLLRCHRATHDHKSFHLKPRLFTFVH